MINLTRWLCPLQHTVIAYVWDTETATEKEVIAKGENEFKSNAIQRSCGICERALHVETTTTKYSTIKEAMPEIVKLRIANLKAVITLCTENTTDPIRVRITKTVRPDLPEIFADKHMANPGEEYQAESNRNGAVSIIFPDGSRVGVKPGEFEFIEAPEWLRKLHAARWN